MSASKQDQALVRDISSYAQPTLLTTVIFFLLFSGPPSFRLRDPQDSLEKVIDPTVILQASVWITAGVWTLVQVYWEMRKKLLKVPSLPIKLGLLMITFLGLSTFQSEAPLLTAFKVGQMFVCLLFTWVFVHRHGISRCIHYVFLGSTFLCIAIAICAFVAPELVLFQTDDGMRLRGDPIAVMALVGTYSTILLLTKKREMPGPVFWPLLLLLCVLLALSLTRQAWFLVVGFQVLYFAKQSKAMLVKNIGFALLVAFPFLFVYYILPKLAEYRSTESIWSLTGRTDLWVYLVGVTLARSPWIGLGYYSASRILAYDFNPGMGTAHSILVEVLLGGGLFALIPCLILCVTLTGRAIRLVMKNTTESQFVVGALFIVTMALGLMGGDFGYGQVGITFWSLAAAIPAVVLQQSTSNSLRRPARPTPGTGGLVPASTSGRVSYPSVYLEEK